MSSMPPRPQEDVKKAQEMREQMLDKIFSQ